MHCSCKLLSSCFGRGTRSTNTTGRVSVKIPPGTQSGKKMRLKSKGIQRLGGYGQGDQIIGIHVETPTKLTSQQREIFENLEQLNNKSSHPMAKGFFDKVKDLFQ